MTRDTLYDILVLKLYCPNIRQTRKKVKNGDDWNKKEIDKLGRICIPKEMRRLYNLENEVELKVTDEGILIRNPEYVLVRKDQENQEM